MKQITQNFLEGKSPTLTFLNKDNTDETFQQSRKLQTNCKSKLTVRAFFPQTDVLLGKPRDFRAF